MDTQAPAEAPEDQPTGPPEPQAADPIWRRVARPALSIVAVGLACTIIANLTLQYSHRIDHLATRPQRWVWIAVMTAICLVLALSRLAIRTEPPAGKRSGATPLALLTVGCFSLAAFFGDAATRPCRSSSEWLVSLAFMFGVGALVFSFIRGKASLAIASAALLIVAYSLTATAFAYSCGVPKAAQSTLRHAMAAALIYRSDTGSFDGFTPEQGAEIESWIAWEEWTGLPTAGARTVQLKVVDAETIVLVAFTDYGDPFCLAYRPATGTRYGQSASDDPASCAQDYW